MNVLGLHLTGHDTGAALAADGRLTAIAEERLDRAKHSGAFPVLSIRYCLDACGLKDLNDIDLVVAVNWTSSKGEDRVATRLAELGYHGRIRKISHHDAHAASAFYASPFDDAAVMVVDGLGSTVLNIDIDAASDLPFLLRMFEPRQQKQIQEVQSFYRGSGARLTPVRKDYVGPRYMNALGLLYMGTSVFLNFGDFGSGKVMGLAPYGGNKKIAPASPFLEIVEGAALCRSEKNFVRHVDHFQGLFFPSIPKRNKETLPDDLYTEIAYEVQKITEESLIAMADHLYKMSPSPNLCYAGGVGLNSVANKKVLDNTPFERIFVQPAACDSGIALGCALYGAVVVGGADPAAFRFKNAYLGRGYAGGEIRATLEAIPNIRFTVENDIVKTTARLLADEKIVGWFQGGSEIGPRALGHRSILCDPRNPTMKDTLNAKVKHREGFRPFAPSVLLEHAPEYFDLDCESPYMLLISDVRENKRTMVPAITHVDGTARVQTVTRQDNGRFYDLVNAFHALTGVPVLLNTSFNIAGEPIVETAADALKCFLSTEMDYLVIEDYLIEAAGPKKLVKGPVVDENALKADDIRNRGIFSFMRRGKKS
jgi:carbamoyltransferase